MSPHTSQDDRSLNPLAIALLAAEASGSFVEPPSARHPLGLDDAYRIGAEVAADRLRRGWRFRGWKVGFTNREIWSRWGLDRPMVAPVYRETVFRVPGRADAVPHARVPMGIRAAPRIEVEVVFGFGSAGGPGAGGGAGATESPRWVALGAELVDCHFEGWRLHPADAVADFGLHAGLVVGPAVSMAETDAERSKQGDALREMAVSISMNGERLAAGAGEAVLEGPVTVLEELGRSLGSRMASYGLPSRATPGRRPGYLVSTGTLTPLVEARIGKRYEVEATLLPPFSFELV